MNLHNLMWIDWTIIGIWAVLLITWAILLLKNIDINKRK